MASANPQSAIRNPQSKRRLLAVLVVLALLSVAGWLLWSPCLAEYHLGAARRAAERCHNLRAQYHLTRCLELRPGQPRAVLLAARVAWRVGSFDVAEQYLDEYQDQRGADDELVLERVLLRAARGEVDEVSPFCRDRVAEDHPSAPLIREAVAAGLIQVYRLHEAENALKDWLDHEPDSIPALLLDATLHELRLHRSEALDRYRRVVELDADHDDARLRMVGILIQHSDGQEALPHAEYLYRRLPDNPQVALRLAQCQGLLGQQPEAEKTLDDLLARQPHFAPALAERGKLALRSHDDAQAEEMLGEAVRRDPSDLDARYNLTQALGRNGKTDRARAEQKILARLEEDAGRIQKIANEQMQQRPYDANLYHEVGVISLRAGATQQGLRWLHRALQIDPHHAATHQVLAAYYQRSGNGALAARYRRLASSGDKVTR